MSAAGIGISRSRQNKTVTHSRQKEKKGGAGYEAFRAASYGGAYSYYEEKQKGTLEPGKRADMIILDQNPFQIKPEEIKDIRVLQTIKDGSVVYRYERKVGCKKEMKKRKKSVDISGMV